MSLTRIWRYWRKFVGIRMGIWCSGQVAIWDVQISYQSTQIWVPVPPLFSFLLYCTLRWQQWLRNCSLPHTWDAAVFLFLPLTRHSPSYYRCLPVNQWMDYLLSLFLCLSNKIKQNKNHTKWNWNICFGVNFFPNLLQFYIICIFHELFEGSTYISHFFRYIFQSKCKISYVCWGQVFGLLQCYNSRFPCCLEFWLGSWSQLPARVHAGRQQVMVQVVGIFATCVGELNCDWACPQGLLSWGEWPADGSLWVPLK